MKKIIFKKASRVGNKAMKKRNQTRNRNMSLYEQDLRGVQPTDSVAESVMECLEDKVSPELLDLLNEMLLGFNEDMQLEIADDLLDFAHEHVIHKTGCLSVDSVLGACYCWIAEEHGIDQEEVMKLLSNHKNR